MNRPLRSGHNEFAEDARGLVVLTHGLAVALQTISTKKSAFSYLQTCNINLVFSLVYSSTNKGTTGGIESVRSKVVSIESSFDRNQRSDRSKGFDRRANEKN